MRWTIKPKPEQTEIDRLAMDLKVENLVARLLLQRGIGTYEEAKKFFRPELSDLHDPFLMKDMDVAVARIEKAISENENILVYGDYDVDGTTCVAMVYSFLSSLTHLDRIKYFIPNRYQDGYGFTKSGLDFAIEQQANLIITLDCGIRAVEMVEQAKQSDIALTVEEARSAILETIPVTKSAEVVPLGEAVGRITFTDIQAKHDIPPFKNSAMDGYAVRHEDLKNKKTFKTS